MEFDINRMCDLAGIGRSSPSDLLRESSDPAVEVDAEADTEEVQEQDDLEALEEQAEDDLEALEEQAEDDLIEIDEKVLVQELRRMKRIMNEAKKKSTLISKRKEEKLQEAQLKAIIDQEVRNVLKDLNLGASWIYGDKKPTQSKKGYLNHGSFIKGIGFK